MTGRNRYGSILPLLIVMLGCVPINPLTLQGLALNAIAFARLNYINHQSYKGEGYFKFIQGTDLLTVNNLVLYVVDSGNNKYTFPSFFNDSAPPRTPANPPKVRENIVPRIEAAPVPYFEIDNRHSRLLKDSLFYVVTVQGYKKVAVIATASDNPVGVSITILPFRPNRGIFLTVPEDHAQINAVEIVEKALHMASRSRFDLTDITPIRNP